MIKGGRRLPVVLVLLGLLLASGAVATSVQAFPTPSLPWLSFKGIGTPAEASAYYSHLDSLPGLTDTLAHWKSTYGFPNADEAIAYYYNAGDLGFGREMHCRKSGADVACYVVNHGWGPGSPAVPAADAAIAGQEVLPTVAMVYRASLDGQPNAVSFYAYDTLGNGARLDQVALDGDGGKYIPRLCLPCHGGNYNTTTFTDTVSGANFLPFDAESFGYSARPGYTRDDQEEEFRKLNALVIATNPTISITELITGWYTDTTGLNTPGTKQNSGFIAPAYGGSQEDRELYTDVVKPYCRTCHIAQGINLATPSQVAAAQSLVFSAFGPYFMPHSQRTNHNFWNSQAPIILAENQGWALKVTRTDDPVPNSCLVNDCSLREAVIAANADPSISAIIFDTGGPITLGRAGNDDNASAGDLDLTNAQPLFILGDGADRTIIDGHNVDRVFHKLGTGDVVIQGVTIRGGNAGNGSGGGIYNAAGALVLNNSVVSGNHATKGGGIANADSATLEVNTSTIGPANAADQGGGLTNAGTATLANSTISGNVADGAIANDATGTVSIDFSTITQNQASVSPGSAGGIRNAGTVHLKDSIVAGNLVGDDCTAPGGGTYVSQGYNLFGENGDARGCTADANDHVVAGSIGTVLNTSLSPAHPVPYHALVPASPAVDAIPLAAKQNCALPSYDQRNEARPLDGNRDGTAACDAGASEATFHFVYLPVVLDTAPDLIGSLTLTPNKTTFAAGEPVQVTATVTNQGTAATSSGFWVDFYINPSAPPAVNQPWYSVCSLSPCQGIAWYVDVTLAPGQSITLTSTADSYAPGNTAWSGSFAAGSSDLYLFVDSWNPPSPTGAVPESNEANNRAEMHGLAVTGSSAAQVTAAPTFAERWVRPAR